ncbi:MAG: hypothetical protein N3E45_13205 [Oscillatoriaceae bacterium SKW80]|nr:hypothetical protein [Oscillatoriaceae bacterium SKYG93]MCX8121758.1 hypothetical protein [Oscillatoriaceae bacterium SKW80]MDW8453625.1 hypothetical protein [Oscillatoriaceae cyanobacterium SKYGB_i_bin93]HIK28690.1 hypothetical protein [Oscillatoriaceae cyanobacterium M7585_C2015_266]
MQVGRAVKANPEKKVAIAFLKNQSGVGLEYRWLIASDSANQGAEAL